MLIARRIARVALALGVAGCVGAGLSGHALAQDKVVRVWHTETEPQTIKAFNDIARRFEAKNPGIKIEAEGLAWNDLEGKIMAALASGSPPELSHGQPITCTALQSKGLLLPLDEVVEGDRRGQYLGAGQARLQRRRQAVRPGACGRHLAADLPQGPGRQGRPEAAEDLGRPARQRQGADAVDQGRRQDRHLRHHAAGRQSVHQHPDGRADQGQRRRAVRQDEQAADDRQEDDRDAGILARAGEVRAARLGGPRLSADLPEPLRPEGRDDVPGLRPRRRHDRAIRPEGDGERQDLRRLGQAARPERQRAGRAGRRRAVDAVQGRQEHQGGDRVPEVLLSGRQLSRIRRDRSDPPVPDHQVAAQLGRSTRTSR